MRQRDRALWVDWCTAQGFLDTEVTRERAEAFLVDTGRRVPVPVTDQDPRRRTPGRLVYHPSWGWPAGFRGRRDTLVSLLGLYQFTRAEITALTLDDLVVEPGRVTISGVSVQRGSNAATCECCVVTRWVRVRILEDTWGRSAVRSHLLNPPIGTDRPDPHDCDEPLPTAPGYLALVPPIDQHGWVAVGRPLSTRALTTIRSLAGARTEIAPDPDLTHEREWVELPDLDNDQWAQQVVDDEHVFDSADEVNKRIKALLDDTAAMLE